MLEQVPKSIEAEQALIGCLLIDHRTYVEASRIVTTDSFYLEKHRLIWRSAADIIERTDALDVAMLIDDLTAKGCLEPCGGIDAVLTISRNVPSALNARHYARAVSESYRLRRLQQVAHSVAVGIGGADYGIDEAVTDLTEEIGRAIEGSGEKPTKAKEILKEWYNRYEQRVLGKEDRYISTGIMAVDEVLDGGISLGRYYLIAALRKMGKTKLAVAIICHLLREQGFSCDFWYTDGMAVDLMQEFIAHETGVSTALLDDAKRLNEGQQSAVTGAFERIRSWPLNIYAKGRPDVHQIALTARHKASAGGRHIVVVDYIQNIDGGFKTELENVSEVSRTLASLRDDGIVILGLAQFNREASKEDLPKAHHLRFGTQIEQDINHMLIFHRPAVAIENSSFDDQQQGILDHCLTKHGPTNRVLLNCDMGCLKFGRNYA